MVCVRWGSNVCGIEMGAGQRMGGRAETAFKLAPAVPRRAIAAAPVTLDNPSDGYCALQQNLPKKVAAAGRESLTDQDSCPRPRLYSAVLAGLWECPGPAFKEIQS